MLRYLVPVPIRIPWFVRMTISLQDTSTRGMKNGTGGLVGNRERERLLAHIRFHVYITGISHEKRGLESLYI